MCRHSPSYKVLRLGAQLLIMGEVEVSLPIDDLPVRIVWFFCAERRPSNETLKHDGTYTPPIAGEVVSLAGENFRSYVIRGPDCGVRKLATRLAPRVDLLAVRNREVDLVEIDGIAIVANSTGTGGLGRQQVLVVRRIMLLVETSREAEISKLDVTTTIKQDIVRFDVSVYEAKLVNRLNGQSKLCHVKARNVFREDFILDEHCHQVTTRQELHEQVKKRAILERCVELDDPWTVRLGENVTFSTHVCKLVLLVLFQVLDRASSSYREDKPFHA